MRKTLIALVFVASACDAAFTDLRPESLEPGDNNVATDMASSPDMGGGVDAAEDLDADAVDMPPAVEQAVAEGMFTPRANYGGEGTATLVELPDGTFEVRLGDDFQVGSVPGPTVVLAREDSLGSTLDPARGDLELGVLESNSGASTYPVPEDPGDRRIVWIYCKPFGLEMASAQMEDQ